MNSVILHFPGGRLATFTASFGAAATAAYDLIGTRGALRMEQAYGYEQRMTQRVMIGGRTRTAVHELHDQFAAEVDYFSQCVLLGREPEPGVKMAWPMSRSSRRCWNPSAPVGQSP
jgi:predicted dehydrogenase